MRNARNEFLEDTCNETVMCAVITFYKYKKFKSYYLNPGYTKSDYERFLNDIDIIYNPSSEKGIIGGIIFCECGNWFNRSESVDTNTDFWEHKYKPRMEDFFDEKIISKYHRTKKLKRVLK